MVWLVFLFVVLPFADLLLLLRMGQHIGGVPTVGLIVGTGLVGAWLARREGRRVWTGWREAAHDGKLPPELLGGLLVLVGAVLLVTPGVITDVLGLLLLVPTTRRGIAALVRHRIERRLGIAHPPRHHRHRRRRAAEQVVDIEGRPAEDEPRRAPPTVH